MNTRIRMITFDAMDTLFTTKASPGFIYLSAARMMYPDVKSTGTISDYQVNQEFKKVFHTHYNDYTFKGQQAKTCKQFWGTIFSQTLANCGFLLDKDEMNMLTNTLYDDFATAKYWKLFPEVSNTLHVLHSKNVKLGIVSNFDERLESVLKALSIHQYFDFIVSPPITKGIGKPDPRPFELALKLGQCESFETVHIGDDINHDYLVVKKLGIQPLLLTKSLQTTGYKTISSLSDLLNDNTISFT